MTHILICAAAPPKYPNKYKMADQNLGTGRDLGGCFSCRVKVEIHPTRALGAFHDPGAVGSEGRVLLSLDLHTYGRCMYIFELVLLFPLDKQPEWN